jgi:hypothetical protein
MADKAALNFVGHPLINIIALITIGWSKQKLVTSASKFKTFSIFME